MFILRRHFPYWLSASEKDKVSLCFSAHLLFLICFFPDKLVTPTLKWQSDISTFTHLSSVFLFYVFYRPEIRVTVSCSTTHEDNCCVQQNINLWTRVVFSRFHCFSLRWPSADIDCFRLLSSSSPYTLTILLCKAELFTHVLEFLWQEDCSNRIIKKNKTRNKKSNLEKD